MNAPRVFLAAFVCLGFAGSTYAQSNEGPTKPWKQVRGFGRVLNLSNPPVVIDEPGLYAIDRDWLIPRATTAVVTERIQITADDVTIDLHGFEISADTGFAPPGPSTLLVISGRNAEVRNGGLTACCEGARTVASTGFGTRLHHATMSSWERMTFDAGGAVTDSDIGLTVSMRFGEGVTVERNTIRCNRGLRCVELLGDGNRVTDNYLNLQQGGGIDIVGNGNFVANNVIEARDAPDAAEAFEVEGDSNVVRGNTLVLSGNVRNPFFVISGTANTIDGNIAAPGERQGIGMEFRADGNFYGNNRIAADVPFSLGGTVQTDWGGNVGY